MKISLITNIPTPYRIPLWKEIENKATFNVICISKIEKNRAWNTESLNFVYFLKSFHFFFHKLDWGFHFTIPFSLLFKLIKSSPDVVIIAGYDNYQYWESLLYTKVFRKKSVFWNGSTLLSSRSKNKIVNSIKHFFINQFDSYYTYGSKASEYLISFGANNQKIITGINTVDTEYYKAHTSNTTVNTKTKQFLFIGQILERKGLLNTIKAFQHVDSKNWHFTIIGTGPDEKKLKDFIEQEGLSKHISFVGYKQKEEILNYFSQSEILLMPSYREVWGLVLNEGLSSGLFCLSSKYAGATFDLIKNNINGLIIDPFNVEEYALKLEEAMTVNIKKENIKNSINVTPLTEAVKIISAASKAIEG